MNPARLSVLTYNAGLLRAPARRFDPVPFVDERLAALPGEILGLGADVVALQEVYVERDRSALCTRFRERYPHVGYVPSRYPFDGGLLTLSRHPLRARLERFRHGPLSERVLSSKGALLAELDVPGAGAVTVVNLHATAGGFWHMPHAPEAERMREPQLDQALAAAEAARGLVLLVGDFNAGPRVAERNYRQVERAGYVDLFGHLNAGDPRCTWDPANALSRDGLYRNTPPQRIDHVFVRGADLRAGRVRPLRSRVVLDERTVPVPRGERVTPSDHYGLYAEVEIAPATA